MKFKSLIIDFKIQKTKLGQNLRRHEKFWKNSDRTIINNFCCIFLDFFFLESDQIPEKKVQNDKKRHYRAIIGQLLENIAIIIIAPCPIAIIIYWAWLAINYCQ